MKIERADEVEQARPPVPRAIPLARPAPAPMPVAPPPINDMDDAWIDMPDNEYEKRFKRMMRLKELEALGLKNKPAPVAPSESRRTGLEVVTLANKLKEEYTALNEASEILNNFSKPNPVEQVLNSEFGKGLGQVVGTIMMNGVQTLAERQMQRRQLAAQQQQQRATGQQPVPPAQMPPQSQHPHIPVVQQPPMQPPVPMMQQPQQQPQYAPEEIPPAAQSVPPPAPAGDRPMKLKLDDNDRKILEDLKGQQEGMLKITQVLASVVERIDNIEKRTAALPSTVPPSAVPAAISVPAHTDTAKLEQDEDIERLFNEEDEVK